jgi:hypothetical protein
LEQKGAPAVFVGKGKVLSKIVRSRSQLSSNSTQVVIPQKKVQLEKFPWFFDCVDRQRKTFFKKHRDQKLTFLYLE